MQGMQVQSQVGELRFHTLGERETKPECCNYGSPITMIRESMQGNERPCMTVKILTAAINT